MVLCDDAYMTELNAEWRGKEAPTDVLSFPMDDLPPGYPIRVLGDIIISVDTAARQAAERGWVTAWKQSCSKGLAAMPSKGQRCSMFKCWFPLCHVRVPVSFNTLPGS